MAQSNYGAEIKRPANMVGEKKGRKRLGEKEEGGRKRDGRSFGRVALLD